MRAQLITRKGRVSLPIFTAALTLALALTACDEKKSEIGNTFTDARDKKTYKTVTIGKQTWMAENLNYEAINRQLLVL
jgi:outer membrane lipoprotein SlyB